MVYIFYTHAQKKEGFYRMQLDHDLYVADSLFTVPKKKGGGGCSRNLIYMLLNFV